MVLEIAVSRESLIYMKRFKMLSAAKDGEILPPHRALGQIYQQPSKDI